MTHTTMSPAILAAALELSRIHGIPYAAFFLLDQEVAFEVIAELLWNAQPKGTPSRDLEPHLHIPT